MTILCFSSLFGFQGNVELWISTFISVTSSTSASPSSEFKKSIRKMSDRVELQELIKRLAKAKDDATERKKVPNEEAGAQKDYRLAQSAFDAATAHLKRLDPSETSRQATENDLVEAESSGKGRGGQGQGSKEAGTSTNGNGGGQSKSAKRKERQRTAIAEGKEKKAKKPKVG